MRRTLISLLLALSSAAFAQDAPRVTNISRTTGPTTGGSTISISGSNLLPQVACLLPCPTIVTFGEEPAAFKGALSTVLHVVTPPHPAGTVDITVAIAGAEPVVLRNAFTYTATAESQYERVMLPIYFDGVLYGGHGSEWTTSLWVRNDGPDHVLLAPWSCPEGNVCPAVFPLTYTLQPSRSLRRLAPLAIQDGNPSRLMYISQDGISDVSFSLRFADRSRGLVDAGIDLPVIRESEALYKPAQLFSVPLQPEFRVLLRVYELGHTTSRFRVSIYPQSEGNEGAVHTEELTATVIDGPFAEKAGYAQLDITGLLRLEKTWPESARIEITPLTAESRFWAFASVTSNDTQIVTLVTPQ